MGQIRSSITSMLTAFAENRLYMGGDVGDTAMVVVTQRGDIQGSTEITRGLYHHNVSAAQRAVEAGSADPSDFRFFAQYAGWAPGQLVNECKRGVWFCAAASPALVLNEQLAQGKALWHHILQTIGGEAGGLVVVAV
jgi:putative transcriptional regulator